MFAIGPGAVWHLVDLHVHSSHTRGCRLSVMSLLEQAQAAGVALLALTDSNSIQGVPELINLGKTLPVRVLPGVELTVPGGRRGVHVLCIFPEDTSFAQLEQMLQQLMLPRHAWGDPTFILPATMVELHSQVKRLGGLCIAAHPHAEYGLAAEMERGQLASWERVGLLQAMEQPVSELNLPVLTGSNATLPEQIGRNTTHVKMEFPGFHELRAALDDPLSRLSATPKTPRLHVDSVSVSGGLLDGVALSLNPHLNCITGGRGTGKSSLVNCLRLAIGQPALDPRLRAAAEQQLTAVLKEGQVSLTISETGKQHSLTACLRERPPSLGLVEVFSQGEIETAALSPEYRLQLLDYHADPEGLLRTSIDQLTEQLEQNTNNLDYCEEELSTKRELMWEYEELASQMPSRVGTDWERLWDSERQLHHLDERQRLLQRLTGLSHQFIAESDQLLSLWLKHEGEEAVYQTGQQLLHYLESAWQELLQQAEQAEQEQTTMYDHLKYRQQVRRLLQLQSEVEQVRLRETDKQSLLITRNELLQRRYQAVLQLRQQRANAAAKLNELLVDVQLSLLPGRERSRLEALLLEMLPAGSAWVKCAKALGESVDPQILFKATLDDRPELLETSGLSPSRLRECMRLLRAHRSFRRLDACLVEDRVELWLMERGVPKQAEELSAGQRCTAMLPLLLLSGDKPLVIDQPEDNLDNAYIFDAVVPALRKAKFRRQLIIVTHNPNLPVLGDAELSIVLESDGKRASVLAAGYLEQEHVSGALQRILEGGREAFLKRATRYGWEVNTNERPTG